jgi:hypothetical protein
LEQLVPLAQVSVGTVMTSDHPVGTVGIPVRDLMNTETVLSVLGTDWSGLPVDFLVIKGNILTLQRNAIIQRMRGDWLLFIDDDMVWERDAIKRLVQSLADLREAGHQPDVLGALCHRRAEPYQPTLYVRVGDDGPYNFLEDWEGRYIEVDATGMAFCLITKQCLERIAGSPMPSYEERIAMDRHPDFFKWQAAIGEDLRFCQDVRRTGGHIMVDTDIRIDHISESRRGHRDFLQQVATREPEVTKARRDINRAMGLPTMSAHEAKRRLRDHA